MYSAVPASIRCRCGKTAIMLINLDSPMLIMKIDIFNHIYPDEYINAMGSIPDMVKNMANSLRALRDVEYRLSAMDKLGIDQEVLSLAMPAIDGLGLDEKSTKHITVEANNGIRSLVEKYKDRFLGIGTVSLSDPDFAADEAKRCIHDLGLSGIQIVSNVNGKPIDGPERDGFYSVLESIGSGLWIHPTFMASSYPWLKDYNADIMLGWDMDTTLAIFRLFRSGILERHEKLKVVVHHLGSIVPLLAGRISDFAMQDATYVQNHRKNPLEVLKSLYVDTAEGMWDPWLRIALDFFGIEHVIFGTDYPWGSTEKIMDNINQLSLDETQKERIYSKNAIELLRAR